MKLIRQSELNFPSIYTSYPRNESCPCGSTIKAKNCCLNNGDWNKKPVSITPKGELTKISRQQCYANITANCSEKISREHCVSETVLKTLADEKYVISVSGMSWVPSGQTKAVGISSLTAKVLCDRHNNALSPIDSEFGRFISTIGSFDTGFNGHNSKNEVVVFCGEDIERWMLKTICAMVSSKMIAKDGKITDIKLREIWLDILYDKKPLPEGWGLYIDMSKESIEHKKSFSLRPLVVKDNNDLLAAEVNVNNIKFHLVLGKPEPPEAFGVRRPKTLIFQYKDVTKIIEISWQDKILKNQILFIRTKKEEKAN
jgi:hypothetical protein